MVARDGIEPPTPAFSGPRSTTELSGLGNEKKHAGRQDRRMLRFEKPACVGGLTGQRLAQLHAVIENVDVSIAIVPPSRHPLRASPLS